MLNAIVSIGSLAFLGSIIWLVVCFRKKKQKRNALITLLVSFVLVGVLAPRDKGPDSPDTPPPSRSKADIFSSEEQHTGKELSQSKEADKSQNTETKNLDTIYEFDKLQSLFISITESTTIEDIESAISENDLFYSVAEYNKSSGGKSIHYVIAYTQGSAAQKYADPGDYLEISFDKSADNCIMNAHYVNSASYSALFYNYGTWYSFREDSKGIYSGYYIVDSLSKEDGLTVEYSNGNKTVTHYFPYSSAEDAIKSVIDHQTGIN